MNQPNKVPRKITLDLKRHQRLMVGLSWDPLDTKYAPAPENRNAFYLYDVHRAFNFLLHIRSAEKDEDGKGREKDYAHFDLDLICFALDHDGNPAAYTGPAAPDMIDEKEVIYHSGENYSGYGGHDDEQIHIEMNRIPSDYENLFFVAASDSKFSLNQVQNPVIRLVDCKDEKTLIEMKITAPVDKETYNYVFGRLYRKGDEWFFQDIGEFAGDVDNWPEYLKKFV
ncbi:MAG: TerD family protein [Alphaproteobacteria bacterium]|nr:TerD family protein [Alphaproteobacteria bacterium]MCB9974957.1 TerD family protein [Rhodospirillales bacterium]